eukprot:IDg4042t1
MEKSSMFSVILAAVLISASVPAAASPLQLSQVATVDRASALGTSPKKNVAVRSKNVFNLGITEHKSRPCPIFCPHSSSCPPGCKI